MQSITCFADDKIIPVEQLPVTAKAIVKTHFANTTLSYAIKDFDFKGAKNEAKLSDGTKIDFDKNGNWEKVFNSRKYVELVKAKNKGEAVWIEIR